MGFMRTRSDGKEVEIVSINNDNTDYYQWGKNCANLEQTEEEARKSLSNYGLKFSAEQSDEFWRGFVDNQVPYSDLVGIPVNRDDGVSEQGITDAPDMANQFVVEKISPKSST